MNVLSLFNGMGTLRQALYDMNINVDNYYSSEIKKAAITLQQHHFPDVIQVGNINNWREWDINWGTINFIGSGSPCQDLSAAGKRTGLSGKNSSLFWVFIDILNYVKSLNSDVKFLQENVGSANRKDVGIMSRAMGVNPIRINSNLVTAQHRDRYYWSNIKTKKDGLYGEIITNVRQPENREIKFTDIIIKSIPNNNGLNDLKKSEKALITIENNSIYVLNKSNGKKYLMQDDNCLNLGFPPSLTRGNRILKNKSSCLMENNENLYTANGTDLRLLNKIELCRLQGFPDDYCEILPRNQAASLLGDGWTLPIIIHILQYWDI